MVLLAFASDKQGFWDMGVPREGGYVSVEEKHGPELCSLHVPNPDCAWEVVDPRGDERRGRIEQNRGAA
jgi:hypothetical protein